MSFLYVVGFNDLTKVGVTNDLKSQMDRISPEVIYQVFFSQNYLSLEENLESFLSKETLESLEFDPHRILTPLSQQGFSKGRDWGGGGFPAFP